MVTPDEAYNGETDREKAKELQDEQLEQAAGGGPVIVKENETLAEALQRFKTEVARSGVLQEVRKRTDYEKPSVRRPKKPESARKKIP